MSVSLTELPDGARIWIYAVDRPLTADEEAVVRHDLLRFVDQWTAHGARLRSAVDVIEKQIITIAVDEASASASGCSIDALTRHLRQLERKLSISLLDGARVFYRAADGGITACDRPTFKRGVRSGQIEGSTPVFDLTLGTLADLRAGHLERALRDSWHRQLVTEVLETT